MEIIHYRMDLIIISVHVRAAEVVERFSSRLVTLRLQPTYANSHYYIVVSFYDK
jgi:hypothetical protein